MFGDVWAITFFCEASPGTENSFTLPEGMASGSGPTDLAGAGDGGAGRDVNDLDDIPGQRLAGRSVCHYGAVWGGDEKAISHMACVPRRLEDISGSKVFPSFWYCVARALLWVYLGRACRCPVTLTSCFSGSSLGLSFSCLSSGNYSGCYSDCGYGCSWGSCPVAGFV